MKTDQTTNHCHRREAIPYLRPLRGDGNWLFHRWNLLPFLGCGPMFLAFQNLRDWHNRDCDQQLWGAFCFSISVVGLLICCCIVCGIVGSASKQPPVRNARLQVANVLNTTRLCSLVRSSLNLGNFLSWRESFFIRGAPGWSRSLCWSSGWTTNGSSSRRKHPRRSNLTNNLVTGLATCWRCFSPWRSGSDHRFTSVCAQFWNVTTPPCWESRWGVFCPTRPLTEGVGHGGNVHLSWTMVALRGGAWLLVFRT